MMRNFCFTVNNYTQGDAIRIANDERLKYVIYGFEKGDKKGTPHLQGYAELHVQTVFNTVRLWYPWSIQRRKGSQDEAANYCRYADYPVCCVENRFVERGEKNKQGSRSDLDGVRDDAASDGMRAVVRYGNMQQIRVAEKYLSYCEEPRDWPTKVIWLWGESGAGKSRRARELVDKKDCWVKNDGSKWFDGYDGHKYVIFDDFRDNWFEGNPTIMYKLLDRYEAQVETKGGHRQFKPEVVVITSIWSPENMYGGSQEPQYQWLRRISEVFEIKNRITEVGGNSKGPDICDSVLSTDDMREVDELLKGLNLVL